MIRAGNRFEAAVGGFRLDTYPDPNTGSGFRVRVRVRVRVRFFLAAIEMVFTERFSFDDAFLAAPISAVGSLASEIIR